MTPNKYCCKTCEHRDEWATFPFGSQCPLYDFNLLNPHVIIFITERTGCTSHSSFLNAEQWIADAVEELRKLGNRESKRAYEVSDRCRQCYCDGVAKGCQTAISLLQEVKK